MIATVKPWYRYILTAARLGDKAGSRHSRPKHTVIITNKTTSYTAEAIAVGAVRTPA